LQTSIEWQFEYIQRSHANDPDSESGYVLGAANYRPLRDDEVLTRQILFRTHWI
jgi:hypothetical protein